MSFVRTVLAASDVKICTIPNCVQTILNTHNCCFLLSLHLMIYTYRILRARNDNDQFPNNTLHISTRAWHFVVLPETMPIAKILHIATYQCYDHSERAKRHKINALLPSITSALQIFKSSEDHYFVHCFFQ